MKIFFKIFFNLRALRVLRGKKSGSSSWLNSFKLQVAQIVGILFSSPHLWPACCENGDDASALSLPLDSRPRVSADGGLEKPRADLRACRVSTLPDKEALPTTETGGVPRSILKRKV